MAASATLSRERVRALNDQLRQHRIGGTVVVTPGVAALAPDAISAILTAVASFDGFDPNNDPYGEHDCAVLTVGAKRLIWKIDYYDRSLSGHSPRPCRPAPDAPGHDPDARRGILTLKGPFLRLGAPHDAHLPTWKELTMAARATAGRERVRALNDLSRRQRLGGQVVITPGVLANRPGWR